MSSRLVVCFSAGSLAKKVAHSTPSSSNCIDT
jgi:hypothetical protein